MTTKPTSNDQKSLFDGNGIDCQLADMAWLPTIADELPAGREPRTISGENDDGSLYEYKDYSKLPAPAPNNYTIRERPKASILNTKLPFKLNAMLTHPEFAHIISWMPHGRAWKVHNPYQFVDEVVPLYFESNNYNSFIRLTNAWGFRRLTKGPDKNAYYHELFLCGMPHLHSKMRRLAQGEKKTHVEPDEEPDLYKISKLFPLPSLKVPTSRNTSAAHQAVISSNQARGVPIQLILPQQPNQHLVVATKTSDNIIHTTTQHVASMLNHLVNIEMIGQEEQHHRFEQSSNMGVRGHPAAGGVVQRPTMLASTSINHGFVGGGSVHDISDEEAFPPPPASLQSNPLGMTGPLMSAGEWGYHQEGQFHQQCLERNNMRQQEDTTSFFFPQVAREQHHGAGHSSSFLRPQEQLLYGNGDNHEQEQAGDQARLLRLMAHNFVLLQQQQAQLFDELFNGTSASTSSDSAGSHHHDYFTKKNDDHY